MDTSQNFLSQCFVYDPEKSELIWGFRPPKHFQKTQNWEKYMLKNKDKEAGLKYFNMYPKGTLKVKIEDHFYSVPAIIWCLEHGVYDESIRNDDGNPWNNKLENLTKKPSIKIPFPLPRGMEITKLGFLTNKEFYPFDKFEEAKKHHQNPRKLLMIRYCECLGLTDEQTGEMLYIAKFIKFKEKYPT